MFHNEHSLEKIPIEITPFTPLFYLGWTILMKKIFLIIIHFGVSKKIGRA